MENASDALLITAGILIGVMIISLGTYLFMTFGSYSKNINDRLTEQQKEEFNAQFTKYETIDGKDSTYCTAYDIISVINLAKDTNKKNEYELGTNLYIEVKVDGSKVDNTDQFLKDNIINSDGTEKIYKCKVTINNIGLVNKIDFKK